MAQLVVTGSPKHRVSPAVPLSSPGWRHQGGPFNLLGRHFVDIFLETVIVGLMFKLLQRYLSTSSFTRASSNLRGCP